MVRIVLLALGITAIGCAEDKGADSGEPSAGGTGTTTAGTTTGGTTTGGTTTSATTVDPIVGTWSNEVSFDNNKLLIYWTAEADGSCVISAEMGPDTLKQILCSYETSGESFEISDKDCPAVGEYTYTVDATTLSFTLISDPKCDGRVDALTDGPWERVP